MPLIFSMEYLAVIKNGDIVFANPEIFSIQMEKLEGERVTVKVEKVKRKRSDKQNRWYWGLAIPTIQNGIEEQTGERYDKNTIHAMILNLVGGLKMETKIIMGMNVIEVKQKRTSEMTTEEFCDFYEKLQAHFAEKDIIIPDPEQESFFQDLWKK